MLLENGVYIDNKNNDGTTAFNVCFFKMLKENIIIELLIKNDAKIDELDNNSDDVYAYLKSNEYDNPDEVSNIKKY